VEALVGNFLGRKRRDRNGRSAMSVYRFVCYLDRLPPHILEDDGFYMRPAKDPEVECELVAEGFADAVADAIRALEDDFTHVLGIERLP
jgi:hypothetical protein